MKINNNQNLKKKDNLMKSKRVNVNYCINNYSDTISKINSAIIKIIDEENGKNLNFKKDN